MTNADLAGVTRLDLARLGLEALPASDLAGLTGLKNLWLYDNRLTTLGADTFAGLTNLELLGLVNNPIVSLPADILAGLTRLRGLNWGQMQLTTVPASLAGLTNLEFVYLNHNQLVALPPGIFSNLPALSQLWLHANRLTKLPEGVFAGSGSLEELYLSENRLTQLPPGLFGGLADLKYLSLDRNGIEELPGGIFVGLTNLESLSLWGNPGGPFPLTLQLVRTDSTNTAAQGPATVVVRLANGAPFEMPVRLAATGGTLSTSAVTLAAGAEQSGRITVTRTGTAPVTVRLQTLPAVPEGFWGLRTEAGAPLVLFDSNVGPDVTVSFARSTHTAIEGGLPVTVAVRLSAEPGRGVTIPLVAMPSGGATAADYELSPSSLTFGAATTEATVTVTAVDDADDDDGESVILGFGTLPAGVTAGSRGSTTVIAIRTERDLVEDREALEALYHATNGPGWTHRTNWLSTAPLGEWFGVATDGSRVIGLDLPRNGLRGPIPRELSQLANLERLDLGDNDLSGPIPRELSQLANLEWLDLHDNDLSGPIPRELSQLASLEWLGLTRNRLSGPIPDALGNLGNLQRLYLWNNQLSGPIPDALANLANLRTLALSYNRLSGPIPAHTGRPVQPAGPLSRRQRSDRAVRVVGQHDQPARVGAQRPGAGRAGSVVAAYADQPRCPRPQRELAGRSGPRVVR